MIGADQPLRLTIDERITQVPVGLVDVAVQHAQRTQHRPFDPGPPSGRRWKIGQEPAPPRGRRRCEQREARHQHLRRDAIRIELGDERRRPRRIEPQRLSDRLLAEHLTHPGIRLAVGERGLG